MWILYLLSTCPAQVFWFNKVKHMAILTFNAILNQLKFQYYCFFTPLTEIRQLQHAVLLLWHHCVKLKDTSDCLCLQRLLLWFLYCCSCWLPLMTSLFCKACRVNCMGINKKDNWYQCFFTGFHQDLVLVSHSYPDMNWIMKFSVPIQNLNLYMEIICILLPAFRKQKLITK